MATTIEVKHLCPQCHGDGTYEPSTSEGLGESITCPWPGCNGEGFVVVGKVTLDPGLDDVIAKCNDISDLCNDILEAINAG